ncbi:hypothetical protein KIF59_23005 [Enterobacter cloacae subsp. cloacae]|nr:hypothetical protein [Enterobacter cloacae subsp. cloacae]
MSGTGEAGATIAITITVKRSSAKPPLTRMAVGISNRPKTLTDGSHSITVSQTDKAGNVSEPSDERDLLY